MKINYQHKLKPVIRYLEQNYNTPFNLEEVANKALLSPYHFHRVFKAVTGETLNDYLRRLRLQQAAMDLFYKKPTITEVALEYGFSSSQSFAKAFRRHFDLSPSELRDCPNQLRFISLLQDSKIGHSLRKNGNAESHKNGYSEHIQNKRRVRMKKKRFDKGVLAYIRVTGPYGENYEPAVKKLYQWAETEGIEDAPNLFIYHDNPEVTPADKCRTDICLLLSHQVQIAGEVELQAFTGGSYATTRKTITDKSQYAPAWNEHIAQLIELGLEMDDRPCFELYHSYDKEKGVADVSLCSSIK